MDKYRLFCNKVSTVLSYIAGALLTVVFVTSAANIVLRNIFNYSWLFSQALLKITFVWMVFIGVAVMDFRTEHLKMDFLSNKFSKTMTKIVDWATMVIKFIILGVMIIYGFKVTKLRMSIPFPTYKKLGTGWMYLSIPVSAILMVIFSIDHIGRLVRTGTIKEKTVEKTAEEIKKEQQEIEESIKELKEMEK